MSKDLKYLIRLAEDSGWSVRRTRGGHWQFVPALAGAQIVTVASTPSDHRAFSNIRAALRRSGLTAA